MILIHKKELIIAREKLHVEMSGDVLGAGKVISHNDISESGFCWPGQVTHVKHIKSPVEDRGIDPRTSRMLSERSTIWASSPDDMAKIAIEVTP